jgi:hypothetical protein
MYCHEFTAPTDLDMTKKLSRHLLESGRDAACFDVYFVCREGEVVSAIKDC